jgi:hypothetical protein
VIFLSVPRRIGIELESLVAVGEEKEVQIQVAGGSHLDDAVVAAVVDVTAIVVSLVVALDTLVSYNRN